MQRERIPTIEDCSKLGYAISFVLTDRSIYMDQTKKIGIVTGGGDCAGLNTVIASIVKAGIPLGYEFVGFERGWNGLLSPTMSIPLDLAAVRHISHQGGTILKTTNKGRFRIENGTGGRVPMEVLQEAKANLDRMGIAGIIALGGDGSLTAAMQLGELGIHLVGVPKTIDNDLGSTDRTFGFSTAVQIATEAIDRVHTTAASHERIFIVECMGAHAGWITLFAGLAGSADAILIPERRFEICNLVSWLKLRQSEQHSAVIAIAEGVRFGGEAETSLGGVSGRLMREIEAVAPDTFEMRAVVLGHTQRGGTPNAEDRLLSKRYGVAAMHAYANGKYGQMVALRNGMIRSVPILEAVGSLHLVSDESPELQVAKSLGVFIG